MGSEIFHQKKLQVLAYIIPYNFFMNSVDIFAQIMSTHMMARQKKRFSISIFTLLFDAAVHNSPLLLL